MKILPLLPLLSSVFSLALSCDDSNTRTTILGSDRPLTTDEEAILQEQDLSKLKTRAKSIGCVVVESDKLIAVLPARYGAFNRFTLALSLLDLASQSGIHNKISTRSMPEAVRLSLLNYITTSDKLAPVRNTLRNASSFEISPYVSGAFILSYKDKNYRLIINSRAASGYLTPTTEKPIIAKLTKDTDRHDLSRKKEPYDIAVYTNRKDISELELAELESKYFEICRDHLISLKQQFDRNTKELTTVIDSMNPFGVFADQSSLDMLPPNLRTTLSNTFLSYANKEGLSLREAEFILRNATISLDRNSLELGISFPDVDFGDTRLQISTTVSAITREKLGSSR